ncbi:MAG: glycosyltransferase family 4 protein [Aquisalimonadaceae bacterium]
MRGQATAFWTYLRQVRREVRGREYDLVFATTAKMFTGTLGALCARQLNARFYLDVRDIFNDTVKDLFARKPIGLLMPVLSGIERFTVNQAARVNVVSEGFLPYFEQRYPKRTLSVFPNGIDDAFLDEDFTQRNSPANGQKTILYAGNIGQGQGLHHIVPGLAAKVETMGYGLDVIGDGASRGLLKRNLEQAGVSNVRLHEPVNRAELVEHYRQADVLFLHLDDMDAFRRVLPSKIFEYAATGKPLLAGVAGHAASFLRAEVRNAAVFPPCDVEAGLAALGELSLEMTDRQAFTQAYKRDAIMARMAEEAVRIAQR